MKHEGFTSQTGWEDIQAEGVTCTNAVKYEKKNANNGSQKLNMGEVRFKGKETQNPRSKPQTQALRYQGQTKTNIKCNSTLN